ncbi:MAG: hypothetical protein IKR73_01345, partial [Oscillospiraceae bacterium]|nr:hypothetical protein [Oscillospiraceae bacterium]
IEFVRTLCGVICIPLEQQRLINEAYMAEKLGDRYSTFKHIAVLMETLPMVHSEMKSQEQGIVGKTHMSLEHTSFTDSIVDVTTMCMDVVLEEMTADDPHIMLTVPVSHSGFFVTLLQAINFSGKHIRIDHYGRMLCEKGFEANFDKIRTGLMFCTLPEVEYRSYFYYSSAGESEDHFPPYPYCLRSSKHVVFMNDTLSMGIVTSDPSVVRQMDEYFLKLARSSKPFFDHIGSNDILSVCSFNHGRFIQSIGYVPCFSALLTVDLMRNALHSKYKNAGERFDGEVSSAEIRRRPSHTYFSYEGLLSFARTGELYGMPEAYFRPFTPEERVTLLTRLRSSEFDIIDPECMRIGHIQVTIPTERSVLINISGTTTFSCHIDETFLSDGFDTFIRSLGKVGYLLSEEEKLRKVDMCIKIAEDLGKESAGR